jgi:hypothetical protein
MKINFHKSEVIPVNLEEGIFHEISHILNCWRGGGPFKYLGGTFAV